MTIQTDLLHHQPDAILDLLAHNPHPFAQALADFHRANRDFIPAVVAELRWLKETGQKPRGLAAIAGFLRSDRQWNKVGNFAVDENLLALMARVIQRLYADVTAMLRTCPCEADNVRLGEPSGVMPSIPVIHRVPTDHMSITSEELTEALAALRVLVKSSPDPKNLKLVAWSRHFESQPEVFAFMQRKLRQRNPGEFSARDVYEYTRESLVRATGPKRHFTFPTPSRALYCRALVLANLAYNGWSEFDDGPANVLLGLKLAPIPINGEPHRRLLWEAK